MSTLTASSVEVSFGSTTFTVIFEVGDELTPSEFVRLSAMPSPEKRLSMMDASVELRLYEGSTTSRKAASPGLQPVEQIETGFMVSKAY